LFTNSDNKLFDNDSEKFLNKNKIEVKFDRFVSRLKDIYTNKYNLILKKLNLETFDLDNDTYLLDVKEISFEKIDLNSQKLKIDRFINKVRGDNKFKNLKLMKENPKINGMANFYNSMVNTYKNIQDKYNLKDYLTVVSRDSTADDIFKELRPNCPYKFSDMLYDKVSIQEFSKYASINLWNK
jgi:hypothetical protein